QEFSVEQQQVYKRRLENSEGRLDAARRASIASTIAGSAVGANNVIRARSLVEQADLEIEENRTRIATVRDQWAGKARENDPAALNSSETVRGVSQLVGLERQLAGSLLNDVGTTSDPGGAARAAIARKLIDLETQYFQNAATALPGLPQDVREALVRYKLAQADLEAKQARRAYLASQVSTYESQAVAAPDRDITITRLSAEVE